MIAVENDCSSVCRGFVVATSFLIVEETDLSVDCFLRTSLVPSSRNLYRS